MAVVRMGSCWFAMLAAALLALSWVASETLAQPAGEKERILNEMDVSSK